MQAPCDLLLEVTAEMKRCTEKTTGWRKTGKERKLQKALPCMGGAASYQIDILKLECQSVVAGWLAPFSDRLRLLFTKKGKLEWL